MLDTRLVDIKELIEELESVIEEKERLEDKEYNTIVATINNIDIKTLEYKIALYEQHIKRKMSDYLLDNE